MNQLHWTEIVANLATTIGIIIAAWGAWLAYGQLRLIKQANYAGGFIKASELLQNEEARKERAFVYSNLKDKPFKEWTTEERLEAEKVCQKFDTVGAMASHNIITWDMAMHWDNTVRNTWKILKPLVESRREKDGNDFWDDYQIFAEKAANRGK